MGFLVVLLLIIIFRMNKSKNKLKLELNNKIKEVESEKNINMDLDKRVKELENQNTKLSKFQHVVDIEKTANEILEDANKNANQLKARYEFILSVASLEAKKIVEEAKLTKRKTNEEIKELKAKYEDILSLATVQAEKIVEDAKVRAEEIAGEAYHALNNTKDLENTAKAMKNLIDGYGNEYIIPTHSLLDELGEEFGHTEAGQELTKARERTRMMIKNNTAAKCDYVENFRRETAIKFILDAFNGKVDTILSSVKHDNYGVLQQKIKDSYQVVNNLGKAFRNAVIAEEYLNARLEELKWAVSVNELKLKEKEEQRLIKEQMREEEKARREYERAIKEAAKEEELLKKLMEKAQKELSEASEQQKLKFEEEVKNLQEKLKAAEEKNQRALSMSQQTRAGHVYVISNIGSFGEDVYKIGMTRRLDPSDRVRELGDASVPFSFDIHAMIYSEDAPKLETELHKTFARNQLNKVNLKKEFFRVNIKEIKEEIDNLGIKAKWTMLAEAQEYRESLAIQNGIINNNVIPNVASLSQV